MPLYFQHKKKELLNISSILFGWMGTMMFLLPSPLVALSPQHLFHKLLYQSEEQLVVARGEAGLRLGSAQRLLSRNIGC